MEDSELNDLLTAFLSSDALPPSLARSLTQAIGRHKELDTPLQRKLFKVRYLAEKHRAVFDDIASRLNRRFGSPKNPLGYSSSRRASSPPVSLPASCPTSLIELYINMLRYEINYPQKLWIS